MKKLAIFIPSLQRGGAERVTVRLAEYVVHQGLPCTIITKSQVSEHEYQIPQGVERFSAGAGSIMNIRRAIIASNADVLLIMDTPACIFAIPACAGLPVKTIVSERNAPAQFAGKAATKYLSRFLMRFADGFVFQTDDAKHFYDKWLNGRGTVIPNPLLADNIPEPYYGAERKKTVVAVGRLNPQKNHALLLKAFAGIYKEFPDYTLVIYGEGALRDETEQKAAELGIADRVQLPGNKQNVLELIRDSSLFVMPSDFEGMPNALIEAMALGLPCISTDCPCGGPRYLIDSGNNGVLVPVGDADALANAMRDLLSNPQKASEMGEKAVKVREKLDAERIGARWMEYLESV